MTPERARELLDAEEERLRTLRDQERARLSESLEAATAELTSFDQHPADVATETHEREVDQSFVQAMEEGILEVEAARRRVEEGTYGQCQLGGGDIPDERLEVVPTARYCVEHQTELEQRPHTPDT